MFTLYFITLFTTDTMSIDVIGKPNEYQTLQECLVARKNLLEVSEKLTQPTPKNSALVCTSDQASVIKGLGK